MTPPPSGSLVPRLDPAVFRLPVEELRAGFYTDAYFNHTKACSRPKAAIHTW
jgi:hypothetical protein